MYMVVRRYAQASELADVLLQQQQEVKDLISAIPGFKAYHVFRTDWGDVATITICDDQAGTDESIFGLTSSSLPTMPITFPAGCLSPEGFLKVYSAGSSDSLRSRCSAASAESRATADASSNGSSRSLTTCRQRSV